MKIDMNGILVIGTGYVGLVLGACIANSGFKVNCMDINREKIDSLTNGIVPIYEPNLDAIVKKNLLSGNLKFHTDIKACIKESKIIFFAVGTPIKSNGDYLLKPLFEAVNSLIPYLEDHTIILKSTIPIGTSKKIKAILQKNRGENIKLVVNPEFLREGSAVQDFMKPDRIVIGSNTDEAKQIMIKLYSKIYTKLPTIVSTSLENAEIIKSVSNAFLATKLAFINQISDLCEKAHGNIIDVSHGLALDHRIGKGFLKPGPGYGGSCFPKDTKALLHMGDKLGVSLNILASVIQANEIRKKQLAKKVLDILTPYQGKSVAILGLTFKANTDDIRDSPIFTLVPILKKSGIHMKAFDPKGIENAKKLLDLDYCNSAYTTIKNVNAIIILTEWDEFGELDMKIVKKLMISPIIIDFRNMYDIEYMNKESIQYFPIGIFKK